LLKDKRFIWSVLAVVFVVVVFLAKNNFFHQYWGAKHAGLQVNNETISDLVNKDSDGDTVPDWQEKLWGTDPMKKDTDGDGVGDAAEISSLEKAKAAESGAADQNDQNLTATDRFARELFSTVAALEASGQTDPTTLDKLSVSLAGEIQTSAQTTSYTVEQMQVISDNSKTATATYNKGMGLILKNYNMSNVIDILKNAISEDSVDSAQLKNLDPIIKKADEVINSLIKIKTPSNLKFEHLELINALEKMNENLKDIKKIDTDTVLALSAVSQYSDSVDSYDSASYRLQLALWNQLNK
jgi:hypothetical protein